jgi:hypothetical protein
VSTLYFLFNQYKLKNQPNTLLYFGGSSICIATFYTNIKFPPSDKTGPNSHLPSTQAVSLRYVLLSHSTLSIPPSYRRFLWASPTKNQYTFLYPLDWPYDLRIVAVDFTTLTSVLSGLQAYKIRNCVEKPHILALSFCVKKLNSFHQPGRRPPQVVMNWDIKACSDAEKGTSWVQNGISDRSCNVWWTAVYIC